MASPHFELPRDSHHVCGGRHQADECTMSVVHWVPKLGGLQLGMGAASFVGVRESAAILCSLRNHGIHQKAALWAYLTCVYGYA